MPHRTPHKRARDKRLYRNEDGHEIERVAAVFRIRCPNGCTETTISYFLATKSNDVICNVCFSTIPHDAGVWGSFEGVFVPEEGPR